MRSFHFTRGATAPSTRSTQAAPHKSSPPVPQRVDRRHPERSTVPDDGSLKNLWRLLAYTKPYIWWLFGATVTGLLRTILPLYMPLFFKNVMDNVIRVHGASQAARLHTLWGMMPLLGGLMVMHAIVTLTRHYWAKVAETNAVRDIRYKLFDHIQRLSLEFHNQRPTGSIVTRVMSDVATAQAAFDMLFIQGAQQMMVAVWSLCVLFYHDWQWALVSLATLPFFGITTRAMKGRVRRASRQTLETNSRVAGHLQERISMIREVQSFTNENYERRRVQGQVRVLRGYTLRQVFLQAILMMVSESLSTLGTIIVLIFGAYRVIHGQASEGDVVLFYLYTGMLLAPVNFINNMFAQLQVTAVAANRVAEYFDTVPTIQDAENAKELQVTRPAGVRFEHIAFRYPDEERKWILQDVDFEAKPGGRVVLVGGSGSGKSTLMNLLSRFYAPEQGRILIDGQDIQNVTTNSLRGHIGIVPQQPVLFRGTVRENLLYGRRGASDEEIHTAAKAANAEQFILQLPDGYDTIVGERGVGLSGGQVQRIAIARAFLKDPAVLILDEATSNLDATSEALVLEALDRLSSGRTTFIIAHRLSVARTADLIVAMNKGRIVEMGTHDELLEANGYYADLWTQQMEGGVI